MPNTFRHPMITLALVSLLACALALPVSAQDEVAALFNAKCSSCHAVDGSGKTDAAKRLDIPDLRSKEVQSLSDEAMYDTIARGTGHKQVPHTSGYRGLTENNVRALVKHIRQLAAVQKAAPPAAKPKGKVSRRRS